MIRKLFLSLAFLGLVAGTAEAWPNREALHFVTNRGPLAFNYADSLVATSGTTALTSLGGYHADTTGSQPLYKWVPMSDNFIRSAKSTTIPDSIPYFGVFFYPGPGGSLTSDTLFVQTQVSHDGNNWVEATSTGPTLLNGFGVTATFVLESGSSNTFGLPFYALGDDAAANFGIGSTLSGTAPADEHLWGWKFIRWIVSGDWTGELSGEVGYWTAADMP